MATPLLGPSGSPALIDGLTGETLSFRSLVERGETIAHEVGGGRRLVFLLCRNDLFSATAYAGAYLGGHVVALIDADLDTDAIRDLIETYSPSCVAGPPGLADRLSQSAVPIDSAKGVLGGELVHTAFGRPIDLHPELAVLLSTSGTTGSRKFVRLSTRNIDSNAAAIADYLGLTSRERPITSLPLHYTFGLSIANSHWRAGAAVVVTGDSLVQPAFWDTFRKHDCTSLAGVPFSFAVLERVGFREMHLPSLTTLQQAGGALDRRLAGLYSDFMMARGGRLFVMYGQTEATARIAYVPPERLGDKLGSAGIAIPGGTLRIHAPASEQADGTRVGEVIYEGPSVMLGYARDRTDLVNGDELGGVLETGDTGYLDEEGYLFLTGRSKRIAKVFGHRVNLDEIETLLAEEGPVAVVDGEDAVWAFCAFGSDDSIKATGDTLARRLRLHRTTIRMRRVDTLPMSSSGKIDYQQVREWAQDADRASRAQATR